MGQRENSLTDRDVIVKLSIKVFVQQSEKVGGVKRRRVELVQVSGDGIAVPPHALVADLADVVHHHRNDVLVFPDVFLDRHLVVLAQVKDQLVSGAVVAGRGALPALELALVHPLVLLVVRQLRKVRVGVDKLVHVVLQTNRIVLVVEVLADTTPLPGQDEPTKLAGVIDQR